MGILDPKKRVMDIAITPFGRASLAKGGLNIAYATFTDGQAYYDPSSITGSYDTATDRIYLESPASLPHDLFCLSTDDTGKLLPEDVFGTSITSDGSLYERSIAGSAPVVGLQSGSAFSSAVNSIVSLFQQSFDYSTIIGSRDPLDENQDFIVAPNTASFDVPLEAYTNDFESINNVDSLFFDKRFANLPQFKYLPPFTAKNGVKNNLGKFINIKRFNNYTLKDLKRDVFGTNAVPVKQRFDVDFKETTNANDITLQMYEITTNGVTKLDAVDFGEVIDRSDKNRPQKRIIFFGKVFLDDTLTATYVNLFTVVLD